MFILYYFDDKKEIIDYEIGQYAELRAKVEDSITNGKAGAVKCGLSPIRKGEKIYVLPVLEDTPKKRGRPKADG